MTCPRCGRVSLPGVRCPCKAAPMSRLERLMRSAAFTEIIPRAVTEAVSISRDRPGDGLYAVDRALISPIRAGKTAAAGRRASIQSSTVSVVKLAPLGVGDLDKALSDGMAAVVAAAVKLASDRVAASIFWRAAPPIDPEPAPTWSGLYGMSYPLHVGSTRGAVVAIDPGGGDYPTLTAQVQLPDTPELRRIVRLYLARPGHRRRMKRVQRLMLREHRRALSE